jgi:predicted PurR-regulated permease PerM
LPETSSARPDRAGDSSSAPFETSLFLLLVAVVAALYLAREVLMPITLAVMLSFVLAPLVGLLRRTRLPRTICVLLAVIFALGVILGVGGVIGAQVADLVQSLPRYASTLENKVDKVRGDTLGRLDHFITSIGHTDASAGDKPAAAQQADQASSAAAGPKPVPVVVEQASMTPMQLASRFLSPALSPFATLGIVLVVAIFILLQQEDLRDRMIRLFGAGDLHRTTLAIDDGSGRLSRYYLTQLCVNVGFGITIGTGLYFIGVPSPILWGVLSGVLRFVPYVGSIISALFPIALSAAVEPGWAMAIKVLVLYLVVEPVVGYGIEPQLYGHSTGLSPVAVVISAIFWSWIWGPIGLLLSMPLTLCLVVLGRHVKRLEFLDVLLGDRPALTPVESFYQRILAGDADEARDHAEAQLKDSSLTDYYDNVAVSGLQLAIADAERGIINRDQLARIQDDIRDVVRELGDHDDGEAPPAGNLGLALCVAGRGPLDEAATAMMAQLLVRRGVSARIVPHVAISRNQIDSLDPDDITVIVVCYVEISGNPAHLRYMLGRLKRRAPGVPIVVGLWPQDDPIRRDEALRRQIGADAYVVTLRGGVDACVELSRATKPADAPTEFVTTP